MSKEVFNGGEMTELNHLYSKREPLSSAPTSLNAANQKHDSRFPRARTIANSDRGSEAASLVENFEV